MIRSFTRQSALAFVIAGTIAGAAACRQGMPVIDIGPKPPAARGTLSGTVRTVGGEAVVSRKITITDIASGAKFDTSTAQTGGYTIQLPAGRYRMQLELRAGEVLTEQPEEVRLNESDVDASRNFVITLAGTAKPPGYF